MTDALDRPGDGQMMGQEQAGQVVADRGIVERSGVVDARMVGVDDQGGGVGHEPGEAGKQQRHEDEHDADESSIH